MLPCQNVKKTAEPGQSLFKGLLSLCMSLLDSLDTSYYYDKEFFFRDLWNKLKLVP